MLLQAKEFDFNVNTRRVYTVLIPFANVIQLSQDTICSTTNVKGTFISRDLIAFWFKLLQYVRAVYIVRRTLMQAQAKPCTVWWYANMTVHVFI